MSVDVRIGDDELSTDLPTRVEPDIPDGRPPSVASTHSDNEDCVTELWDEIDVLFQAQEDDFVEEDEALPSGTLVDAPATLTVKGPSTPMSPTLLLQPQPALPGFVSNPPLSLARESPSRRFFASPDQIDALGMPETWLHGQVISTLGDTFCHISRSKPRQEQYEILPTNLLDLWDSSMEGHASSRTSLSWHFMQAVSPSACRAWLIPVLLEHHWYLLAFDWVDCAISVYDSLAASKIPHRRLSKFAAALLLLIAKDRDLDLTDQTWNILPEQVSSSHYNLIRF